MGLKAHLQLSIVTVIIRTAEKDNSDATQTISATVHCYRCRLVKRNQNSTAFRTISIGSSE